MRFIHPVVIFLLISTLTQAQFLQNSVIKTKPVRCAITWNPVLGVETQIKDSRFTISQEFTYILRTEECIGFESTVYAWSKGFSTLTECRFYFDRKLKYPRGHYFTLQAGYYYSFIENVDYFDFSEYLYTANTTIKYPEINFAIGKQILWFNRLSIDFLVGLSTKIEFSRKLNILQSYDHRELIGTDIYDTRMTYVDWYCQLNLGILLFKPQSNRS